MTTVEIIVQLCFAGALLWLALRKAPSERSSLNGSAVKYYAEAAQIKAEENVKLEREVAELAARLEIVERKKYRIVMEFTIGDPPEMGKVLIEPIVPEPKK
jgi:hypothetical protein